jgi:hypothetical protein
LRNNKKADPKADLFIAVLESGKNQFLAILSPPFWDNLKNVQFKKKQN